MSPASSSSVWNADILRWALVAAALSGALAVALGAFGAHALADLLTGRAGEVWATASQYHFVHSLALAVGALIPASGASARWATSACVAWLAGIAIFSGSLYLLALTGVGWLGAITPVGGAAFILGWLALAVAAIRSA
jgi:uncharacterized membrane protein YgdD (TMEM256/DUF423 family)